jgi:hypothetical protein
MGSNKQDCSVISDDSRFSRRVASTALTRPDTLQKKRMTRWLWPSYKIILLLLGWKVLPRYFMLFLRLVRRSLARLSSRTLSAWNLSDAPSHFINDLQAESYF